MDININYKNSESIESSFENIADSLMNNWLLQVGDAKYRIAEIEFYFDRANHKDSYTHKHTLQRTSGKWYFHPSGLDLTCGDENTYGGILIRAIYSLERKEFINGPQRSVTELFCNLGTADGHNLFFGMIRDEKKELKYEKVYKAPRVGLNPDKDKEAFAKLYRFLIMPKEGHSDKQAIIDSLVKQGGCTREEAEREIYK